MWYFGFIFGRKNEVEMILLEAGGGYEFALDFSKIYPAPTSNNDRLLNIVIL